MSGGYIVQCFYKGTPFPVVFTGSVETWNEQRALFDGSIVSGLRSGHSIKDQQKHAKGQLDVMEGFLMEMGKTAGDGCISATRWEEWMEKEFIRKCTGVIADGTPEIGMLKMVWYMNVHMLIKTKVINDDQMNGWIMMGGSTDKDFADLLASLSS